MVKKRFIKSVIVQQELANDDVREKEQGQKPQGTEEVDIQFSDANQFASSPVVEAAQLKKSQENVEIHNQMSVANQTTSVNQTASSPLVEATQVQKSQGNFRSDNNASIANQTASIPVIFEDGGGHDDNGRVIDCILDMEEECTFLDQSDEERVVGKVVSEPISPIQKKEIRDQSVEEMDSQGYTKVISKKTKRTVRSKSVEKKAIEERQRKARANGGRLVRRV